ncbi:BON domain-containing protein [Oxalobacteraceae bacterium CAVE-383]|nr:BON domain-containing protein [Oxalobacteraceae bacterium CAVE-383]
MSKLRKHWAALRRPLAAVAVCGMVAIGLQGCIGVLAGGAIATGFAASDRRTLGAQAEDKSIMLKAGSRVEAVVGTPSHINTTSFNRKLLLTGEVRSEEAKQAAGKEAAAIPGVEGVFNELTVGEPSSVSTRSSDTYITSKVLASLFDAKDVFSNSFKVVTENGVVYLMGLVTQREGDRGAEIVRGISGVQKVVTVYEYLTEAELAQIGARQAESAKKAPAQQPQPQSQSPSPSQPQVQSVQ